MITRIYVEKKPGFDVERQKLLKDIQMNVHVDLKDMRLINVYDVKNLKEDNKAKVINTVLSEPNVDEVYETLAYDESKAFRIKLLPGQFDQRADSAKQCIEIVTLDEGVAIESSKLYILEGPVDQQAIEKIKDYLINPVENTEVPLAKPKAIGVNTTEVSTVEVIQEFIHYDEEQMNAFLKDRGFAMDLEDILFIQTYFKSEDRNPTITELKVLDTYWSDHCRHTTFFTTLESIHFEEGTYHELYKNTFNRYLEIREELNRTKPINLMDLATIMMKYQHAQGNLDNLDISEEVNACSVEVTVDVDGEDQDYLVMFKNETHNHPTEIEPFGGAATCLGGAIRDPLSGRAYVYQGMRVTGSADPRTPIEETMEGKLPQRIITQKAAKGFSSYGNQIGLPAGLIDENYDENFIAKRMEVGAVVGATPAEEVQRERPSQGDLILLIGGKTGRDGCGGATGSSKKHTEESIITSGAEVQKGNAPEERKLQRLYRKPEFSKRIKRSNDFGAGGVSVAIGEIADSIEVNLDKVPKKYEGLDGTELAISESQERMAIVIDQTDLEIIQQLCHEENVEATVVAKVTDTNRFIMKWQGETIFDISRDFIKTSGVSKKARVKLTNPKTSFVEKDVVDDIKKTWIENLKDLNVCSKKGLVEMFDNTVGANTVLMPFGGKTYNTPTQTMVAKIPVEGKTNTCTIMTYGYHPKLGQWSPFHSGVYNVLSSIAKIVSTGGKYEDIRFSFQEYFERLGNDPEKWGKPFSALLGTILVQDAFNLAAIGGKDSMSGTFNDINVPPTLISFAIAPAKVDSVISPELKEAGHYIYRLKTFKDSNLIPDFDRLKKGYELINQSINDGTIVSAYSLDKGKLAGALTKMAFGNEIGITVKESIGSNELFSLDYGSIVFESTEKIESDLFELIGHTIDEKVINVKGVSIDLKDALQQWSEPLEEVFPTEDPIEGKLKKIQYKDNTIKKAKKTYDHPRVLIPSFPGTNCEIDTKLAFEKVGADANVVIFKNQNKEDINRSIETIVEEIQKSQIIAFPGGFSAGDEPDGSGKFIASVFRHPKVKDAINEFLNKNDGLIIGICNGFQALIKLGLLPYGEIKELTEDSPTLTFNKIGRHISKIAKVKMTSNKSPWLKLADFDKIYETPLSHGEGRFYAKEQVIDELIKNGQIATQYVDDQGNPTYDGKFNPNGSIQAVEGLTSKDGRIFGKMGHVERLGDGLLKNIYNIEDMKIFKSGVEYFKK